MPFASYKDFDDCVAQNQDKESPEGYCSTIMRTVESRKGGSPAYYEKLALELTKHVPEWALRVSMAKARGQAASMNRQVPDADDGEYISMLAMTPEVMKAASPRQLGVFHHRAHQLHSLEFSRVPREQIAKAHAVLAEEMTARKLTHEPHDDLDEFDVVSEADFAKAEWTTAYINELPDSAFAFVEPGEKDDTGRTVPRSNRHFPHHDASGTLDLPHFRNAVQRAPQSPFGDKAMSHLKGHELKKHDMIPRISQFPGDEPDEVVKADHDTTHGWAASILAGHDFPYSLQQVMKYHDVTAVELIKRGITHNTELEKSGWADVFKGRMFFTSPGGKNAMASRIIRMIPEHRVYVEPFAGGAAVLFAKEPSEVEVINDLDKNIYNTYKTAQSLTDEDISDLTARDWTIDRGLLKRLQKMEPQTPLDAIYKFLYLKGASYGGMGETFQTRREGQVFGVAKRLPEVRERLKSVKVTSMDAVDIIRKTDSPETFFFVDPPYPAEWKSNMGQGYTNEQLQVLVKTLQAVKGKFLLTVSDKERKYLPDNWMIKRIPSQRSMHIAPATHGGDTQAGFRVDMELIASNWDWTQKSQPDLSDVHVPGLLRPRKVEKSMDFEFLKAEQDKQLVWAVVMKPNYVDADKQWVSADTIMETAHRYLLKGPKVYMEHMKDISDQVKVVESWILPSDMTLGERTIPTGSWVIVMKVLNPELWQRVKSGLFKGVSIRGFSKVAFRSPASANA